MSQIKLFSVNGQAGMHNCVDLQRSLKIPYGREISYKGTPYQPTLSVYELDQIAATPEDRTYHLQLVEEGKITHGGQQMQNGAMVDIPAHPNDCTRFDKPAIASVGTNGLDPAMILSEMYTILETERHKLRDEGHSLGGEAENYVAGIRIVNRSSGRQETAAIEITPDEFKEIAHYMSGKLEKDHPIAEKIENIREAVGYNKDQGEEVTPVNDGGTVGQAQNRQR